MVTWEIFGLIGLMHVSEINSRLNLVQIATAIDCHLIPAFRLMLVFALASRFISKSYF